MFGINLVKDASGLQTNRRLLYLAGGLFDGTWQSLSVAALRIGLITLGVVQLLMKMTLGDDELPLLVKVEILHWVLLFSTVVAMLINCLTHSTLFFEMEATIRCGFYDYGGNLIEKQIMIRAEANKEIRLFTLVFASCCATSLVANYIKAPLLMDRWILPYPMWMPFEINSWFRYLVAMVWTWFSPESVVFSGCSNWVIYVTMANHLIAQFRILIISIKEIDSIPAETGSERKGSLSSRIEDCVKHHLILIKFFDQFQEFFDISLATIALNTGLILCAVGYIIMSPDTSITQLAPLLLIIIPELLFVSFYCMLGERISEVAEEVGLAVYNIKWYTMPLPLQRDLLMMLVGSKKVRRLTAIGLQEFSLKGLSEIIKASFTYLNMLSVLSKQ